MRNRHGMSIVELLVVMSIVGLLVGVLIPAVQSGREAARRASCANNLKQIGLALLNHEQQRCALPIGAATGAGGIGASWWVDVLPFLGERALHSRVDRKQMNAGFLPLHPDNGNAIYNVVISAMLCPSSPIPPLHRVAQGECLMPSFVGISGASSHDGFAELRVNPCCLPANNGEISGGGALIPNRAVTFAQVLDGLSNTLAVAECSDFAVDAVGRNVRVDGGFPNGWLTGTVAAGTPPNYYPAANAPPSWNIITIRYAPNMRDATLPGVNRNRGANNPLTSAHPGLVQGAFLDGSVRKLPNAIDVVTLKRFATRDDRAVLETPEW